MAAPKQRRARAKRDVLAANLSLTETRKRAKGYLRRYYFQGLSATEAQRAVAEHPDFAGAPPSPRSVQMWWSEIVHGDPVNLVDPELLAQAGHSLEDHRKAAIARSSVRIMRLRTLLDDLYAVLGDLDADAPQRADVEGRVLDADKRLADAERNHARFIGYDEVPLSEQLSDDVGRSRIVHALAEGWRHFTDAEADLLLAGLQADLARRARERAEDAAIEQELAGAEDFEA